MKQGIILFIITVFFASACTKDKLNIYEEVYDVEFIGTWSETTHPTDFPSGAHFSPVAAISHVEGLELINVGLSATEGVKSMAETGSTDALEEEFDDYRSLTYALDKATGESFDSPGSYTFQIGVERGRHTVTVFSMIAPSPDWFVAATTSLLDPTDGLWYDEVTVYPSSYDAGTDSGLSFTSVDSITTPQEAISFLNTGPLTEGTDTVQNMAKIIFRRVK